MAADPDSKQAAFKVELLSLWDKLADQGAWGFLKVNFKNGVPQTIEVNTTKDLTRTK